MSDFDFIKEFNNIKMNRICKDLGFNSANLSTGKISAENLRRVKNEIIKELLNLIVKDKENDLIVLYLYNEILEKIEKENNLLKEMLK